MNCGNVNYDFNNEIMRKLSTEMAEANEMNKIDEVVQDERSQRGQFGWATFGSFHIPYIFRGDVKYCSVRIVENRVLGKYFRILHQDIYNCTSVKSYYITIHEANLLNQINFLHCDSQFGREHFTSTDLVVRLDDAVEFYKFLDSCYTKLLKNGNNENTDKFGFVRINNESVVPFTTCEGRRFVPLFYFEGETDHLKVKANKLVGWDLCYLKFCCKVQGIRNQLFAHDSCSVISLEDVKLYFPPGTIFQDYWPTKMGEAQQLLISSKTQPEIGHWTTQPAGIPPKMHVITKPVMKNGGSVYQMAQPRNVNPTFAVPAPAQRLTRQTYTF